MTTRGATTLKVVGNHGRSSKRRSDAPPAFPIVGIGASAGGLEAFTQLLAAIPSEPGMAFVLLQHPDPPPPRGNPVRAGDGVCPHSAPGSHASEPARGSAREKNPHAGS